MKKGQMSDLLEREDLDFTLRYINIISKDKEKFKELKQKYPTTIYSKIMLTLTHETYTESEAKNIFENIIGHKEKLNSKLNRDVGLIVAAMDYLYNIKNILDEPIIIEERKSDFIIETSVKDDLTTLYLREPFEEFLKKEFDNAKRNSKKLSLMMIDIDDFKNINDTFGHQTGDEVLKELGKTININIRKMDLAARYGGEEFIVVLPNTDISRAKEVSNRIKTQIADLNFNRFHITVSIGLCTFSSSYESEQDMIAIADEALYHAKEKGKNRVEVL